MNGQKLFSWLCKEAFIQRSHLFAGSWGFHTLDYLSRSAPLICAVLFVLPVNEFSQYEIAYWAIEWPRLLLFNFRIICSAGYWLDWTNEQEKAWLSLANGSFPMILYTTEGCSLIRKFFSQLPYLITHDCYFRRNLGLVIRFIGAHCKLDVLEGCSWGASMSQ